MCWIAHQHPSLWIFLRRPMQSSLMAPAYWYGKNSLQGTRSLAFLHGPSVSGWSLCWRKKIPPPCAYSLFLHNISVLFMVYWEAHCPVHLLFCLLVCIKVLLGHVTCLIPTKWRGTICGGYHTLLKESRIPLIKEKDKSKQERGIQNR